MPPSQANPSHGPSPAKRRRLSSNLSAESPRELGQMRSRRDDISGTGSASFVGSASGVHFVRTVRRAFARNSYLQSTAKDSVDEELIPGEDDRLQGGPKYVGSLWREDEISFGATEQERYSFDNLVLWTKSYFDLWHPPFPFLHAPTVLGVMEMISANGLPKPENAETIILRSIMSISVADQRQMPKYEGCSIPAELIFQSVDAAVSSLQPILSRPSSLSGLQAAVSIQLFLISMLRLNAASRIGGLIVRMSFHLGLHRCPSRFAQFSPFEVEIRRRLFWSIYTIDRFLSQSLGLPLDLRDDDIDVCYSNNELHTSSGNANDSSQPGSQLLFPTFLSKHGRIKGMILELRNKSVLHSYTDQGDVAHIDSEISKWWNEVQDLIDPFSVDDSVSLGREIEAESPRLKTTTLKTSHRLMLVVQKHESVILLNRPVLTSGYNTVAFAAALQKCIGASKAVITNVYRHLSDGVRAEQNWTGRMQYPLVWPGFVWTVWQSGLILLYAASEGHYSVQASQRDSERCVSILENLALRGNFWPSACAAAIKDLQLALRDKTSSDAILNTGNDISQSLAGNLPHGQDHSYTRSGPESSESRGDTMANNNTGNETQPYQSQTERSATVPFENLRTDNYPDQTPLRNNAFSNPGAQNIPQFLEQADGSITSSARIPLQVQQGTTQNEFADQYGTGGTDADIWQSLNGAFGMPGDQNNGLYDIFQFMDASYLLNGQTTPAQPGISNNFGPLSNQHLPTSNPNLE